MITQALVHELLDYDCESGVFTWRPRKGVPPRWNTRYAGKPAGGLNLHGHVVIGIDYRLHYAHRLAWLYVYGVLPHGNLDHRDCDKTNNRISNLREATDIENKRNRPAQINSKSGIKGVFWNKQNAGWTAKIQIIGRQINLGTFRTAEAAGAAYRSAAVKHFGAFAHNPTSNGEVQWPRSAL